MSPQPKYLRKQGTNMIFAYSDMLMARGDMVAYDGPIPMPTETIPGAEIPKKSTSKTVSEETPIPKDVDVIPLIIDAIGKVKPEDFSVRWGPKLTSIEEILGFEVTAKQRDEAWEEYRRLKKLNKGKDKE